ncbi:Lrp/AsnC family transcriptional regulator [Mesonia sp. MT50]|uniref:Lrp/AsnC family transcriptional regulator n=1 Tax=Mesonia profundi TaxID=3070998 RepID=A0ABU1A3I9_9FLAO|nr:Lrp/AsnC family transcriptional regulator [Mesonia profundi]MDQ7917826.1 Lrp/AsnC family transcriptional regulator [Mesonia profundi]
MKLDSLDHQLLKYLQQDAKKTTKELALLLGLSNTAVYERIKKLERQKIITNYVALIDKEKVEKDFMVLCQVKLSQHVKNNIIQFEREVLKLEEVLECYHVSGDYDYILKVLVKNMDAYRKFIIEKLTVISGIGSTQSTFVIKEVKNTTLIVS